MACFVQNCLNLKSKAIHLFWEVTSSLSIQLFEFEVKSNSSFLGGNIQPQHTVTVCATPIAKMVGDYNPNTAMGFLDHLGHRL